MVNVKQNITVLQVDSMKLSHNDCEENEIFIEYSKQEYETEGLK